MKFIVGQEVVANDTLLIEYLLEHNLSTKGIVESIIFSKSPFKEVPYIYRVNFGTKDDTLYLEERKLREANNTFNSQAEIWEYLLSGGKVTNSQGVVIYSIANGKLINTIDNNSYTPKQSFTNYSNFIKYIEPAKWYDNIPKSGILCWVCDSKPNDKTICRVVTGYNNDSFHTSSMSWKYADPITQEEINKLIYQQQ